MQEGGLKQVEQVTEQGVLGVVVDGRLAKNIQALVEIVDGMKSWGVVKLSRIGAAVFKSF